VVFLERRPSLSGALGVQRVLGCKESKVAFE
jgi:hypothetical protein